MKLSLSSILGPTPEERRRIGRAQLRYASIELEEAAEHLLRAERALTRTDHAEWRWQVAQLQRGVSALAASAARVVDMEGIRDA